MSFASRASRPEPAVRRLTVRGLPVTDPAAAQPVADLRRQSRIGNKEIPPIRPIKQVNPSTITTSSSQSNPPSSRPSIQPSAPSSVQANSHLTNSDDIALDQLQALLISQRFLIGQLNECSERDALEASIQYQALNQLIAQSEVELEKQRSINQSMYRAINEDQIIKQRLQAAQSISQQFPLFEQSISQSINQISNRINQIELYGMTANQSNTQTINQSIKRASDRIERAYARMHERLHKQSQTHSNSPSDEALESLASHISSSQSIIAADSVALEQIQSLNQSINQSVLSRASHKLTLQNLDYLRDET